MFESKKIAVVIPCYRVRKKIGEVVRTLPSFVDFIIAVDDACPESSGDGLKQNLTDPRLTVITHSKNQGVGGAMITGYRRALETGADIIVKMDGDGQMDPTILAKFLSPLIKGRADYTKGNRMYQLSDLRSMPIVRKIGNAAVSLITKAVTGYWNVMDPANGYTAIQSKVLSMIELERLNRRYFFENDLLYQLGLIRAVIKDIPMGARYADENSSLSVFKIAITWPFLYLRRFANRIFLQYFLRDINPASIFILFGLPLTGFGIVYGLVKWAEYSRQGLTAPTGTVMIPVICFLSGLQFLISAINHDVSNTPKEPLTEIV